MVKVQEVPSPRGTFLVSPASPMSLPLRGVGPTPSHSDQLGGASLSGRARTWTGILLHCFTEAAEFSCYSRLVHFCNAENCVMRILAR
jgi:hypothetical protein